MKNNLIDDGQDFDFGKTSENYAKYRDIYPKNLFDKLIDLGIGIKSTNWLDLGTGTGVLPRALAEYGANIIGTDISENQINQAVILSEKYNNIHYKVCSAENTELESNYFDAITACQCFWYFDVKRVVSEIERMIKNGGIFAKIYMDWFEKDEIASDSQALVKELNPNWNSGNAALYDLKKHCFENPIEDSFTVEIPFTRETWHGRMMTCRGVQGSMKEEVVKKFDEKHLKMLEGLPNNFSVKHKVFITAYKIKK